MRANDNGVSNGAPEIRTIDRLEYREGEVQPICRWFCSGTMQGPIVRS